MTRGTNDATTDDSVEARKERLMKAMEEHPERFWGPAPAQAHPADGGTSDEGTAASGYAHVNRKTNESHLEIRFEAAAPSATSKQGTLVDFTTPRTQVEDDDEIGPSENDREVVAAMHKLLEKLLSAADVALPSDIENESSASQHRRIKTILDHLKSHVEEGTNYDTLSTLAKHYHETVSEDVSMTPAPESPSMMSRPFSEELAARVLHSVASDFTRIVQRLEVTREQVSRESKSKNEVIHDPLSSLLCNEELSDDKDDDFLQKLIEETNSSSMAQGEAVQDKDGTVHPSIYCREEGLFRGDGHSIGYDNSEIVMNDEDRTEAAQDLTLIQELTCIVRAKTLQLAKRRIQG